jgi:hypothetical protein
MHLKLQQKYCYKIDAIKSTTHEVQKLSSMCFEIDSHNLKESVGSGEEEEEKKMMILMSSVTYIKYQFLVNVWLLKLN